MVNTATHTETDLVFTGRRADEPFSYNANKILWTELQPHPRWENQMYSVIKWYDLTTHKRTQLTKQSRYFSPSLSPDGQQIAAIHIDEQNNNAIHILRADDGELIKELPSPNNAFLLTPSWNHDGTRLVLVKLVDNGKKLTLLDPSTEQWTDVTKADYTQIRFPKFIGDTIYFAGSWSGIEAIYRINTDGTQLQQVGVTQYGATYPSKGLTPKSLRITSYNVCYTKLLRCVTICQITTA